MPENRPTEALCDLNLFRENGHTSGNPQFPTRRPELDCASFNFTSSLLTSTKSAFSWKGVPYSDGICMAEAKSERDPRRVDIAQKQPKALVFAMTRVENLVLYGSCFNLLDDCREN